MKRLLAILCLLTVLAGCAKEPLKIGSKEFTESILLAEMFAAVAEEEGVPVDRKYPYGNSFDCIEAIKQGKLDLYPEYDGTLVTMLGTPPTPEELEKLGLVLGKPLGFGNSFVLVVKNSSLEKISDLTGLDKIRFAMPPEFLRRHEDGLDALVRRYGLDRSDVKVLTDDKDAIYRALADGRVDVVVGFESDLHVEQHGFQLLEDDRDFFPPYRAMPLVRSESLSRFSGKPLRSRLDQLAGRLSKEEMRHLVQEVEVGGANAREVAVGFLQEKGLLKSNGKSDASVKSRSGRTLLIAVPRGETDAQTGHLPAPFVRGLRAIRKVFPQQRFERVDVARPAEQLRLGKADMAILGAESFFELHPGQEPVRIKGIEAIAVVDHQMAHLLKKTKREYPSTPVNHPFGAIATMGVGLDGGASARVARFLLDAYEWKKEAATSESEIWTLGDSKVKLLFGPFDDQVTNLCHGEIDAVLKMAKPGLPRINRALESGHMWLDSLLLQNWGESQRQYRYPFMARARITPKDYPDIEKMVETISSQVVLTGYASESQLGDGGPATALHMTRPPISAEKRLLLIESLGITEAIDPALPVGDIRPAQVPMNPSPWASLTNGLVLLLIVIFIVLVLRQKKP